MAQQVLETNFAVLDRVTAALKQGLGENLYSCILYGSAIRGDLVPKASDLNLLIVLEHSTPQAHKAIADIVCADTEDRISPFVLGRSGLDRSQRAFAIKFRSIKRNYRVLHGADVLANLSAEPHLLRFLCEQSVRNLRLRQNHAFITFGDDRARYTRYALRSLPAIHAALSETLRCEGIDVPKDHLARLPLFESSFGADVSVLRDLREVKQRAATMSEGQVEDLHARVFLLLDVVVQWMEGRWPQAPTP